VIVPVAGALAATGRMNLAAAILASAAGNLVGSLAAYGLAARYGEPLLLGPGRRAGLSPAHLQLATRWLAQYGLAAVFVCRILPVARTYISFPAGLARLKLLPFSAFTFLGALPWCAALGVAGYFLGSHYRRVSAPIEVLTVAIAALIVLGLAGWWWAGHNRGKSAEHDGATP